MAQKIGDEVESGELLAEIETDKATMEFESFQDGVLLHIGVDKGGTAPVDSVLCVLGEKGENIEDLASAEAEAPQRSLQLPCSGSCPCSCSCACASLCPCPRSGCTCTSSSTCPSSRGGERSREGLSAREETC